MEGSIKDSLVVRGQLLDLDKGKSSRGRSRYKTRSNHMVKSTRKHWKCGKVGHCKKDCSS